MTVRRWASTTVVMGLVAGGLALLAPGRAALEAALTGPQQLVDTAGPETLLLLLAWTAAVACWTWGAVGLVLTGASALPGLTGRTAGLLLLVVLPAGARRAAALAVGVSLVAAGPATAATTAGTADGAAVSVAADAPAGAPSVPDWPAAPTDPSPGPPPGPSPGSGAGAPAPAPPDVSAAVPDWPAAPPAGAHVVLRGDCLWDVAAAWLASRTPGAPVGAAATAAAVDAWWQANAAVIGPDPDVLLPGQVLVPPG